MSTTRRPFAAIAITIAAVLAVGFIILIVYFGSMWLTFGPDAPVTDYVAEYNELAMKTAGVPSPEQNNWPLVEAIARDISETADHFSSEWQDQPLYIDYSMLYRSDSTPDLRAAAERGMAELDRRKFWEKLDNLASDRRAARLFKANAPLSGELTTNNGLRRASTAITARLVAALRADDGGGAARALRHGLALSEVVSQQPTLADRLVGNALGWVIRGELRNRVLAKRPSADTLRLLLAELEAYEPPPMTSTFEGERLVGEQMLYQSLGTSLLRPVNRGAQIARYRVILELVTEYSTKPRHERDSQLAAELNRATALGSAYTPVATVIPAFGSVLNADDISTADHHGTMLILAIEAHIATTGAPPASLDELVTTGLITELPGDPYSAHGFIYRTTYQDESDGGRGYILYSVGHDGRDDGGRPADSSRSAFQDQASGTDFVFTLPDQ